MRALEVFERGEEEAVVVSLNTFAGAGSSRVVLEEELSACCCKYILHRRQDKYPLPRRLACCKDCVEQRLWYWGQAKRLNADSLY